MCQGDLEKARRLRDGGAGECTARGKKISEVGEGQNCWHSSSTSRASSSPGPHLQLSSKTMCASSSFNANIRLSSSLGVES